MKKTSFVLSDFICPECSNIIRLPRATSKTRQLFHLKKIWCYKCNKEINHIELHNSDVLLKEIENIKEKTETEEKVYQLVKKNKDQK